MLSRTLLLALLIFLPGLTLAAVCAWFGVRGTLKLGLIELAGVAIPGYLLFWVYLASPKAGDVISALLPFLLGPCFVFLLIRFTPAQRLRLAPLLLPTALTFFAALGVISLGFLHGGKETPIETAQNRFSHPLPPDNVIPLLFAEHLRAGHMPRPMLGDWLSSDRPPLQAGMILALEPVIQGRQMDYEVASVIMQCLWVFALWLLMRAFRISRISTALVIGTIYLSGFALVNSLYVWPKLLAAAYTLAAAIPVLALRSQKFRHSWRLRVLGAFLLACGMLSHGGTMFAIAGVTLFVVASLQRAVIRESCLIALLALVIYSPWIGYQKLIDPPGDRLLKWHLAGMEQPNSLPVLDAIVQAYRNQTFSDWKRAKQSNVRAVFGYEQEFVKRVGFTARSFVEIRVLQFFYMVPTIGFVSLGAIGLLFRRKNKELRAARILFAYSILAAIATILLLFEQSGSIIQSTGYMMVLTAMAAVILAFRGALPRVAIVVCVLQSVWTWIVYEPDLRTLTIASSPPRGGGNSRWNASPAYPVAGWHDDAAVRRI